MAVLNRRVAAAIAALALVAASCGQKSNDGSSNVGGSITTVTEPTDGPTTTSTRGSGGGNTATTRAGSSGVTTAGGGGGTTDGDIKSAARGGPGAFGGVLLAAGAADSIVLDVLVQSGVSADADVVSTLRQILTAVSAKPVTVRGPTTLDGSGTVYDADDIRHLADAQGKAQGNGVAVVHLLYLKGAYSDHTALGVTVRGDTIAVFPEQIEQAATPLVSAARIERAVDTHELGHVMGLVDLYLDDGRDDKDHPGHSTNPHSVMYWAVESDLVAQLLDGPPPVNYDGADQADLQKIHAGAPASA